MNKNLFIQSSARIRVKEKSLLTQAQFDRLIDANDLEDALRSLQDTAYQAYVQKLESPFDYEEVLAQALRDEYREIEEMSPDKTIIDFVASKYDYHNMKVGIKAQALDRDLSHIYLPLGRIKVEEFHEQLRSGSRETAEEAYQEVVHDIYESYLESHDPQVIDVLVDREYYRRLRDFAEDMGIEIFQHYVEDMIDFINMRTLLRCQEQGRDLDFLDLVILEGGSIEKEKFKNYLFTDIDENVDLITASRVYYPLKTSIKAYTNTKSLEEFEKQMDDTIMQVVKEAKKVTYGPEVLFGFLMAKETEIKNLRIILVSKLNGLPPEFIKERLRENYA